ncbi:MAG: MCE family protein [Bacteroidetes bacterium]|nr:MCE family protein [Bacteroidota bacterium]MBU1679824.1 MCE family protein [Bacteroidota bacterium]
MKNERKTEVKVGVTVLVALIAFFWVLGWAKNFSFYSNEKLLTINFSSVAGLNNNDLVAVNGVRKGFVKDISLKGANVYVLVSIDEDAELKEDAKFSVMMLDLMGGKKIEIDPGQSDVPIDFNKVQSGNFVGDISTAMAMLSSVQNDLVDVIKEIKISLTEMNKILTDEELYADAKNTLSTLAELTNKVNQIILKNEETINQIFTSGNSFLNNSNALLEDSSPKIIYALDAITKLIEKSDNLAAKVNLALDETKSEKNNLGKLLYDEKLIPEMKTAIEELRTLVKILVEQLKNQGINVDANIF